ncbi:MAG TPA: hypothetical protein VM262_05620 [Acidimicrobiales bacterium]|nr:hypothetical protein [Acidimicrobiales bacterium]
MAGTGVVTAAEARAMTADLDEAVAAVVDQAPGVPAAAADLLRASGFFTAGGAPAERAARRAS